MADRKKIFIVEDDVELAEMLVTYFRVQEYEVMTTTWGEDAVRQITNSVPDVILLDIRLPDIDGYEVCQRLRQSRRTQDLPIIFLTERREREIKLAGLELGAVDYITKPFDIHELRLRVRNVLRRAEMPSMQNAITGLPEGHMVQDQLKGLLKQPDWGLVLIVIKGLNKFRDQYGFVAADDVTRAVSLMITNAMQESGEDSFIGHTDVSNFVIITSAGRCKKLVGRCRIRLEPSIPYFYPAIDRQRINNLSEGERLSFSIGCLTAGDGEFKTLDALINALDKRFD